MKKTLTVLLTAFLIAALSGCSGKSGNDAKKADSGLQNVPDRGSSQDAGGDDGDFAQSGYNDDDSLSGDDDSFMTDYIGSDSSGASENIYKSFKEVFRNCNGRINDAALHINDLLDTEFFNSDAVQYHQYIGYYGSVFSTFENLFSGDERDIKRCIRNYFHTSDAQWSVDGGNAVITFQATDGTNASIVATLTYNGSSSADYICTADGEVIERASFLITDDYSITVHSYGSATVINAVYENGDFYCIYDTSGSSFDFSVYNGSHYDDPASLIGDRQYIACIDGVPVY